MLLSAATVVGLIVPNSLAHALELTGNAAILSRRSGHAGTSAYTLGHSDSDTAAVYGIDVRERSDDPRLVTLGIKHLAFRNVLLRRSSRGVGEHGCAAPSSEPRPDPMTSAAALIDRMIPR